MKAKVTHLITLTLLFCLLMTALACGKSPDPAPENTQKPSDTAGGLLPPDDLPSDEKDGTEVDTDVDPALPAPPEDPEIGTDLFAFNIPGINTDDHIDLIFKPLQQTEFDIGIESRQDPCSVEVEGKFPAELQIEFVVKARSACEDFLRLLPEVRIVVKADT